MESSDRIKHFRNSLELYRRLGEYNEGACSPACATIAEEGLSYGTRARLYAGYVCCDLAAELRGSERAALFAQAEYLFQAAALTPQLAANLLARLSRQASLMRLTRLPEAVLLTARAIAHPLIRTHASAVVHLAQVEVQFASRVFASEELPSSDPAIGSH